MPVSAEVSAQISVTQTATPDGGSATAKQSAGPGVVLVANGTLNGQADLAFVDERTLASGANEELDLAGVLTSVFGATLTFVEVMSIMVYALPANTTNLTVGGAASNAFQGWFGDAADTEVIAPGGVALHHRASGWGVTAGTGDKLKIANASGASATYQIAILGRSA
jgi:hypothetical protein